MNRFPNSSEHRSAFSYNLRHAWAWLNHRLLVALGIALIGAALIAFANTRPVDAAFAARTPVTNGALTASNATAATRTWVGLGGDGRWSNPANWQGGMVPTAADTVRFPAGLTDESVIDTRFDGAVAKVILEAGFTGRLRLARALAVRDEIAPGGGELQQRGYALATTGFTQSGGQFNGGTAPLTIAGAAQVAKVSLIHRPRS